MNNKKQLLLSAGLVLVLVLMIVGVSYAAFQFTGLGSKVSTITSGIMKMSYTESDNVISLNGALPTTDETGKKRLNKGEYFDFTVSSTIQGKAIINWEIALEPTISEKMFNPNFVKVYLTELDDAGNETKVIEPTIFTNLNMNANEYTGKPAIVEGTENTTQTPIFTLYSESNNESFSKKYRLRMWVDKSYNPQGDGGNFQFETKINVYGKVGDEAIVPIPPVITSPDNSAASLLMKQVNDENLDYNTATEEEKKKMWTLNQDATKLTSRLKEYRYIGLNPNNYITFNDELWRIIGIFAIEDDNDNYEWRLKIVRNESLGSFIWGGVSNKLYNDSGIKSLLNNNYYNKTTGIYYNNEIDFSTHGLTDKAKTLVGTAKWYVGELPGLQDGDINPKTSYEFERRIYGDDTTATWLGKIGLVSASDYGFATGGSSSKDRNSCYMSYLTNWSEECSKNNWLYHSADRKWLISTSATWGDYASIITSGIVSQTKISDSNDVYPSVYLKTNVVITGGNGSQDSPYTIELGS